MLILADESVDRQVVERLRAEGHSTWYVAEMQPGLSDEEVLALANEHEAVLLTADRDFGELVFRQRRLATGIILTRLAGMTPDSRAALVARVIDEYGARLVRMFTVIAPGTLRVRHPLTD